MALCRPGFRELTRLSVFHRFQRQKSADLLSNLMWRLPISDPDPDQEEVTICLRANAEASDYAFFRLTLREKVGAE